MKKIIIVMMILLSLTACNSTQNYISCPVLKKYNKKINIYPNKDGSLNPKEHGKLKKYILKMKYFYEKEIDNFNAIYNNKRK